MTVIMSGLSTRPIRVSQSQYRRLNTPKSTYLLLAQMNITIQIPSMSNLIIAMAHLPKLTPTFLTGLIILIKHQTYTI